MARHLGNGLTAKQQASYEMRRRGASWKEIAEALKMSPQSARLHVEAAERNGADALPRRAYTRRGEGSVGGAAPGLPADPNAPARFSKAMGNGKGFDAAKFGEMAAAAGVPPRLADALMKRIRLNLGEVKRELKKMNLNERVADITARADLIASHIDELSIAGLSAKDLSIAWKVLIDGAQLLGGKPTAIVDFNMRAKLEVLMPAFLAEAKRRGITIEGEYSHAKTADQADSGSAHVSTAEHRPSHDHNGN